ncbi:MAG: GNAT family N-acetyltransferase [Roseiflexaceae bacterium]
MRADDSVGVVIRRARPEDAEAYRELRLEALRAHPEAFGGDANEESQRPLDLWRTRLDLVNEQSATFVAVSATELVGMMVIVQSSGRKIRHSAGLYSVYVRAAWRRAGVSDLLLQACLDWAAARGVQIVRLSVTASNSSAIRFYQRNGFQVYGIDPAVLQIDGIFYDELLMFRRITQEASYDD